MILDCHVHLAAAGSGYPGNHMAETMRRSLRFRFLQRRVGLPPALAEEQADRLFRERLCGWLNTSRVERAVVLAFDAVYDGEGRRDLGRTRMAVDNDYVADLAAVEPKVLFGASVHPYRRDALEQLDRVAERGACLVKWLPSAQDFLPDDRRCIPFYERLVELGLPLLSHTGCEHTIPMRPDSHNDPRRLLPALQRGVTVIAAHCGVRLYLYERSWFGAWCELARCFPNCYGDLSAWVACTRLPALLTIRRHPALAAQVLYGSDFPVPVWPANLLGAYGWGAYQGLRRIANPFDRALATLEATGLPADVFSRAGSVLRGVS